jgi:hypothetical protein
MNNPNTMVGRNYPLFEHMDEEHGLTLTEDQLWQIERIVLKMYNIDPENCTESIERQHKEKGNQLDQVMGAIK